MLAAGGGCAADEPAGQAGGLLVELRERFPAAASQLRAEDLGEANRLEVAPPERAGETLRIGLPGVAVEVRAPGAAAVGRELEDGVSVYRGAYQDADVLLVPSSRRVEELVYLRSARAPVRFEYQVSVAGGSLRESGEVVDASGVPRLRVARPWALDAAGRRVDARLDVHGSTLSVELDAVGLDYPVLLDPSWEITVGAMAQPRYDAALALLGDGRVLACGGTADGVTPLSSCELYDWQSGTWTTTPAMSAPRMAATANVLPNGKVLVCGGGTDKCEIFDAAQGSWKPVPTMVASRSGATATLLLAGKVLMAGGDAQGKAELYDPVGDKWSAAGTIAPRSGATAVRIGDDRVLLAGGWSSGKPVADADIYDPKGNSWSDTAPLPEPRAEHTATRLRTEKVIVAGGTTDGKTAAGSAVLYDEVGGKWAATGSLGTARRRHGAALLPSGKLLVLGGSDGNAALASTEIYDPGGGTFGPGETLKQARERPGTALLASGDVVVLGGLDGKAVGAVERYAATGSWSPTAKIKCSWSLSGSGLTTATLLPTGMVLATTGMGANAGLYDPATETSFCTGLLQYYVNLPYRPTATLLLSGRVLVVSTGGAQVYDPKQHTWTATAPMAHPRYGHSATLLPTGRVLVAGGNPSAPELYDPEQDSWTSAGSMVQPRSEHAAALLPTGKVLLCGNEGPCSSSAELYDPVGNTWTPAASSSCCHCGNIKATLLATGKVLATGKCAALYDPEKDSWSPAGDMITERQYHTATLLPNGKVLVAGGCPWGCGQGAIAGAELYDPATNSWAAVGSMTMARLAHGATILPSGKVFVVNQLGWADLYDSGLDYLKAWQPTVGSALPSPAMPSEQLTATGAGFRGSSQASGGGALGAAADVPVVGLLPLEGALPRWLRPSTFDGGSLSVTIPPEHPLRIDLVTVFVAGIPSHSTITQVGPGAVGGPCALDQECISNHCIEGVCCAGVCAPCQSCNLPASQPGLCANLKYYLDDNVPPGACTGANTCDGQGNCKKKNGGPCNHPSECASGFCVDGTCCQDGCSKTCYACTTGTCTTLIAVGLPDPNSQPPCTDANACDGAGNCRKRNGQPCAKADECVYGFCADGLCCDQPCQGLCRACIAAKKGYGKDGACEPVGIGADPDNECLDEGSPACGLNGLCDGKGACQSYPVPKGCTPVPCGDGLECKSGICVDGVCCDAACDGTCEACRAILKGGGEDGLCQFVAVGIEEPSGVPPCEAANACDGAGHCRKKNGQKCAKPEDCAFGFCADGLCCDAKCEADCSSCDLPGKAGACSPEPEGAVDGACLGKMRCDGAGKCRKVQGEKCASGPECLSGFCADEACCQNACDGKCVACNLIAGTCTPHGFGSDPDGDCGPQERCNGFGLCRKQDGQGCAGGSECLSGNCADGVCCAAPCSGPCDVCAAKLGASEDGTCTWLVAGEPGSPSCTPYVCTGASAACGASCASSKDCAAGAYCAAPQCLYKKLPSKACVLGEECTSELCVDGVCCMTLCDGTCEACNIMAGVCKPQLVNTDPDGNCGLGERCDGFGACKKMNGEACAAGGECLSGKCVDGVCCDAPCSEACDVCAKSLGADENGTCAYAKAGTAGSPSCTPYVCTGASAQCGTTCAAGTDCAPAAYCSSGECLDKKADGKACASAEHCGSGFCVDGVCCDAACGEACLACSAPLKAAGRDGVCGPLPAGLEDASGKPPCQATSACDGAGKCKQKNGQACLSADTCLGGYCLEGYCTGIGCVSGDCGAYRCNLEAASCRTSCRNTGDCAAGYRCDSSQRCVADAAAAVAGQGCTCRAAGGDDRRAGGGWAVLLAAVGAAALRRRGRPGARE
ncbi:MAG: hypothetical protein HY744_30360 [Deltaproteobacteria bacterium]|nr:hypothetical protein [Deltaproteobacteria bacterium]